MKNKNTPVIKFTQNNKEYLHLSSAYENTLNSKIEELEEFMSSNIGKGKPEEEKEELFGNVTQLWKNYAKSLKETKYSFYLNQAQWNFLDELISVELEYDVNTVFFAIELTNLLKDVRSNEYTSTSDIVALDVDATQITYIYHLIATYKPKGLSEKTHTFSEILLRIGEVSKVFNYYNLYSENLSGDVTDWTAAFEEGVTQQVVGQQEIDFEEVK